MALPARSDEPAARLRLVHSETGAEDRAISADQVGTELRGKAAPRTTAEAALPERDDAELVALARAGQSAAFEALYRRYSPYAMALGVRVQGSPTDIEDIVHDAFLRVHDRLDSLRAGAKFRPWLASVVVSLVRTRMRRRRMLGALGLSSADPIDLDALVAPDAGPEVRAQLAQVYDVLRRAPVDQSICWTLRYIEGRKLEEVAEVAGCSLATAKRRILSIQQKMFLLDSVGGAPPGPQSSARAARPKPPQASGSEEEGDV